MSWGDLAEAIVMGSLVRQGLVFDWEPSTENYFQKGLGIDGTAMIPMLSKRRVTIQSKTEDYEEGDPKSARGLTDSMAVEIIADTGARKQGGHLMTHATYILQNFWREGKVHVYKSKEMRDRVIRPVYDERPKEVAARGWKLTYPKTIYSPKYVQTSKTVLVPLKFVQSFKSYRLLTLDLTSEEKALLAARREAMLAKKS